MKDDLFIGITSWNSELFLPHCLSAVRANTEASSTQIVVLDNCSDDASASIARDAGAKVLVERCSQADAMNRLIALSKARYTLLIHADVVLLNRDWFGLCRAKISDQVVLVAPEDIGCGPLTRPFGRGKPESSFLFFSAAGLRQLRGIHWARRNLVPLPRRRVELYAPHVTHELPAELAKRGLGWHVMDVHWSGPSEAPIYTPPRRPKVWSDELPYLHYGLGNFYSIDGAVTHYHNWYDRIRMRAGEEPADKSDDFPMPYIKAYTDAFLADYARGALVVPPATKSDRQPVAL